MGLLDFLSLGDAKEVVAADPPRDRVLEPVEVPAQEGGDDCGLLPKVLGDHWDREERLRSELWSLHAVSEAANRAGEGGDLILREVGEFASCLKEVRLPPEPQVEARSQGGRDKFASLAVRVLTCYYSFNFIY